MLFRQRSAKHPHRRALTRFPSRSNFQVMRLAFERSTRRLTIRRGHRWKSSREPISATATESLWSCRRNVHQQVYQPTGRRYRSLSLSVSFPSICLPLLDIVSFRHWIGKFTYGQLCAIFNAGTRKQWTYLADGPLRPRPTRWSQRFLFALQNAMPLTMVAGCYDRVSIPVRHQFWMLDRRALTAVPPPPVGWPDPFNSW